MGRTRQTWEEVDRQPVGVQTGGGRAGPWFCVVYRVTEARKRRGKVTEYRERVDLGYTLRAWEHPDAALLALMQSVATGADALSRLCESEEERRKVAKTKRKEGRK